MDPDCPILARVLDRLHPGLPGLAEALVERSSGSLGRDLPTAVNVVRARRTDARERHHGDLATTLHARRRSAPA